MQKLPLGIQTFSEIIEENYLYVDKTEEVYNLISSGKVFFLSRPRRFGKSLLVSTLDAIFSGKKELFNGLYIKEKSDWNWDTYPVIKLEFTKVEVQGPDDFRRYVGGAINDYAKQYNIKLEKESFEQRFGELVQKLSKQHNKVVFLVDEYDKPILTHITDTEMLGEIKKVMNAFYGVVKSLDEYLKFVFITGVSKFAKISVFSGMNNLTDISLDERYATLIGITQKELEDNFQEGVKECADKFEISEQALLDKVKYWYNGYYFSEKKIGIYNPYSLVHFFNRQKFENFWYTSATPTFLIDLLKKNKYNLAKVNGTQLDATAFAPTEPEDMAIEPLFLQTGYLTIKDYNTEDNLYTIDFPNFEVKSSFLNSIVTQYAHTGPGRTLPLIYKIRNAFKENDTERVFELMKIFFADIPNTVVLNYEKYYQSLFYAILNLLGYEIDVEISTNIGRIDCTIKTDSHIYIIEFKLNGSAQDALDQIQEKKYAEKYLEDKREKILIGIEFSQDERNIKDMMSITN